VVDRDPSRRDEFLGDAKVVLTLVDGEPVYTDPGDRLVMPADVAAALDRYVGLARAVSAPGAAVVVTDASETSTFPSTASATRSRERRWETICSRSVR
jgi:uncharacterized cupin superfamily protein